MHRDRIVEEVHKARRELLREAGGDLASLGAYLRRRQAEEGRKIVRLGSKRTKRKKRSGSRK